MTPGRVLPSLGAMMILLGVVGAPVFGGASGLSLFLSREPVQDKLLAMGAVVIVLCLFLFYAEAVCKLGVAVCATMALVAFVVFGIYFDDAGPIGWGLGVAFAGAIVAVAGATRARPEWEEIRRDTPDDEEESQPTWTFALGGALSLVAWLFGFVNLLTAFALVGFWMIGVFVVSKLLLKFL